MAEVTKRKYPVSPTLRLVEDSGRATAEFQRLLRAISELVEAVTIEDGEITTEMLEAEIIRVSTLFADEVVITSKVAPNAISELSALIQAAPVAPGNTICSGTVPIDSTNNTGLLLTFTAFMSKPVADPANNGAWTIELYRNGVFVDGTPALDYDDNYAYQPVASFIDETPGDDPFYVISSTLLSGPGNFSVLGGVCNVGLLKR